MRAAPTWFVSWLMPAAGQEGKAEGGAAPSHSRPEVGRVQAVIRVQDGMEGGMLLATAPYHTSQTCPDEGIREAVTVRAPPLQQQAAPGLTKSRVLSDSCVSSDLVAIQYSLSWDDAAVLGAELWRVFDSLNVVDDRVCHD